jgi:NitT/TauT family transport system substrate-binding protein
MPIQSRRRFLTNAVFAGAAGLGGFGVWGKALAAEPPPEITTIRFERERTTCIAPEAVAQDLLRAEGFNDIRYVDATPAHAHRAQAERTGFIGSMLAHGEIDFGLDFAPSHVMAMESSGPITILAGLHVGCFEVFAKDDIHTIGNLKGRTVGATHDSIDEVLLRMMVSLVGLDPTRDVGWLTGQSVDSMQLFVEGKIDAYLALPPALQEMRARHIGHVIVSSITDRPWSQYYCCLLATRTEFAQEYPIATRRVLRAMLKAADFCAAQPARAAQLMVGKGFATRYDYTLQALSEVRYDVWRDWDPEDTLRFYALRLHEAGLIQSTPQKLIAEHTDWRFLDEIKRELKA